VMFTVFHPHLYETGMTFMKMFEAQTSSVF